MPQTTSVGLFDCPHCVDEFRFDLEELQNSTAMGPRSLPRLAVQVSHVNCTWPPCLSTRRMTRINTLIALMRMSSTASPTSLSGASHMPPQ